MPKEAASIRTCAQSVIHWVAVKELKVSYQNGVYV